MIGWVQLWRSAAVVLFTAASVLMMEDQYRPADITDDNNAGCGRWFPRFHPKNALPLGHNNDANAPFYFNGVYHVFMQACRLNHFSSCIIVTRYAH